ncbi:hypothetical protein Hypma_014274 [Hypsizygus marmoreus]|uniref:Uncharacterized protein n=1 Tax=Hypsizygus marmoreus TaxID=39966 RepID=A0A369JHD8_HYPMA|nr:hypothetical protein Hypma_014274 [Hypsizygus marmoreus]
MQTLHRRIAMDDPLEPGGSFIIRHHTPASTDRARDVLVDRGLWIEIPRVEPSPRSELELLNIRVFDTPIRVPWFEFLSVEKGMACTITADWESHTRSRGALRTSRRFTGIYLLSIYFRTAYAFHSTSYV